MSTPHVKIRLSPGATAPSRAHDGDAGFDLHAHLSKVEVIYPQARKLIPTGVSVELPAGVMLSVRSRSGMAIKHGVVVANSPGTVDSGYRGEVGVVLINHGDEPFVVNPGDRVAQAVFEEYLVPVLDVVDELAASERGEGGFGSTGAA